VVGNADKPRLAEITHGALKLPTMPAMAVEPGANILFKRGRERAFVKVQDGCRYRCTYCIVTIARGQERSRSIDDLVAEIQDLTDSGVQEVVLTGVHVGGFGSDLGCTLADLVAAILERTAIPRLRFASVEPWDLPRGFFDLFSDPRLMPHIHLPLQSGSDSVLRRMARRCKTSAFADLVDLARASVPDFNVTTDIIVGFPGETDVEWRETLEFVEKMAFGHVHIFPYSARPGTKAASLPGTLCRELIKERCEQLFSVARDLETEGLKKLVGRVFPVLWEQGVYRSGPDSWAYAGYTPSYHRVAVESAGANGIAGSIRAARVIATGETQAQALLHESPAH